MVTNEPDACQIAPLVAIKPVAKFLGEAKGTNLIEELRRAFQARQTHGIREVEFITNPLCRLLVLLI